MATYAILSFSYPLPDTFPDSATYVHFAGKPVIGGFRPIGYSLFLSCLAVISSSPFFLSFVQFVLNAIATLFLLTTIQFFIRTTSDLLSWGFSVFLILSPSILYLTNYVMSDSLFITLTNMWLATAIWVIGSRKIPWIILHLLIMCALIEVRYTGIFYPAVTVMVFLFAFKNKNIALVLGILTFVIFNQIIVFTKSETERNIGVSIFSGFSGWQVANNALHVIPYIDLKPDSIEDKNLRFIHQLVLDNFKRSEYPKDDVTGAFLWDPKGPLKGTLTYLLAFNKISYLQGWHLISIEFKKYGSYLIMHYPTEYAAHYIWPNTKNVFYPKLEAFSEYRQPDEVVKEWFECPNTTFETRWPFFHRYLVPLMPASNLILWILLFAVGAMVISKRINAGTHGEPQRRVLWIFVIFGFAYCTFNIYASPVVLRYLSPIHSTQIAIMYILLSRIVGKRSCDEALKLQVQESEMV